MNRLCILGERNIAVTFAGLMLFVTITPSARHARADCTLSQTYSTLADFNAGSATDQLIVGDDDIQVKPPKPMLPFFNVACSVRGTMARVDILTGTVVGEYWTAPEGRLKNPSRTTVDQDGNVWIANRDENGLVNGTAMGSITRIGYIVDKVTHHWVDASKRYVKNPDGTYTQSNAGEYVKLDATVDCTGVDRDGDGYIHTSTGLSSILNWDHAHAGGDDIGGVTLAEDELIINYTRVAPIFVRTLAIDAENNLWVGGNWDGLAPTHEKVTVATLTLQVSGTPGTYTLGVVDGTCSTNNGDAPMPTGTPFTIIVGQ